MTPERWAQVDPRLRAAWECLVATGRRRFHDEDPALVKLMQQAFLRCGPHAVRYAPWFDGGGQQLPADYVAYQEVLFENAPLTLVEVGTGSGGTTCFFAEVLERRLGRGGYHVVTVEVDESFPQARVRARDGVTCIFGDSADATVLAQVRAATCALPCAVTLDGDHDARHVLAELELYAPLVTPGQHLIVQDTFLGLYWGGNLDGYQAAAAVARGDARAFDYHGCPLGAVEAFLEVHGDAWEVDLVPQRLLLTQNPYGYLRRRS